MSSEKQTVDIYTNAFNNIPTFQQIFHQFDHRTLWGFFKLKILQILWLKVNLYLSVYLVVHGVECQTVNLLPLPPSTCVVSGVHESCCMWFCLFSCLTPVWICSVCSLSLISGVVLKSFPSNSLRVWCLPSPTLRGGATLQPSCAVRVCHSESVWICSQTEFWYPTEVLKSPDWISQI